MCGCRPLFKTACGFPLKKAVLVIGIIQIIITVIATICNVVNLSMYRVDCDQVDICWGPVVKYAVVDALFGVICGVLLIFGSRSKNSCLLISWVVIVFCMTWKYVWVIAVSDWSSIEVKKRYLLKFF